MKCVCCGNLMQSKYNEEADMAYHVCYCSKEGEEE